MGKESACSQEAQVPSLGLEDLLEKEMTTHSSILAWKIPWIEEPGGPQSIGLQELGMTEPLTHIPELPSGFPYFLQFKSESTVNSRSCFC